MIDLHETGRPFRYRAGWDESRIGREKDPWLMILPGYYGHVYVHGPDQLAFATTPQRARKIVAGTPGCRVLQEGDDGWNVAFPIEALGVVGKAIGLRKRRVLTAEQKAKAAERLKATRFTSQTTHAVRQKSP
jgi:hypothetical protein